MDRYSRKYKKPLKFEQTGFFTLHNVLQAMPRLTRSKEYRRMLIEAPSMPTRCDDAPLRAAQQYSGRCSPTVSAALPPTLADPYARSSDLPPPDMPPGLPPGFFPTLSEISPAHAELSPGLFTGFGVPVNDIPRFVSQQLALHTTLHELLCEYIYEFGPVAVDTIVHDVSDFRHFVQSYAKEFHVPSISFTAVLASLPQIERVEGRDGMSEFRYVQS
jgi:hypothetical protein